MNEPRQRVIQLFEAALELSLAERSLFLANECAGQPRILAAVRSLLDADDEAEAESFMSQPALEIRAHQIAGELGETRSRQTIGRYQLLELIGEGGMGEVYLAQDHELDRKVAVKLIKGNFKTQELLRRFNNERHILAHLNHANIASLLDGGTTDDGVPFFVMEYVAGQPIDRYADEHQLSTTDRLKLFRIVCEAVQYAHQHLIIHRDLKPTNILVTSDGDPKLLDFGIAKLLVADDSAATAETATVFGVMTPEYASPEQVRGEPITTATDVYSLGVVLYELLTGQRPHKFKSRQPADIAEAICSKEPDKPSSVGRRQTADGRKGASINGEQSTTDNGPLAGRTIPQSAIRNPKLLRGDLDNIVLMAMRKDPRRRYTSVGQLSEDIARHLDGLPVIARTDTFTYRASKFIKRNRLAVAAAAVILMVLIGGIIATAWEAHVARIERARAEQRFNQVRKLAHSVLFDYHDAIADLPGSTPVRQRLVKDALEYLDSLSRDAGRDVSLQREVASAYEKIGKVQGNAYYADLGNTEAAMKSYRKSLEIRTALAKGNPGSSEIQDELASSYEGVGDILNELADLNGSLQNYQQALAIRKALVSSAPANTSYRNALAEIYGKIGDVQGMEGYPNLGDTAGALASYQESVRLREEILSAAPQDREARQELAFSLLNFGSISGVAGDSNAAAANGRRSVSLFEAVAAEDPNNVTARFNVLAAYAHLRMSLVDGGQLIEAVGNDRKTIQKLEEMTAADPNNVRMRRSLGVSYSYLGRDLRASGDPVGAAQGDRRALAIAEANAASDLKNPEWQYDLAFDLQVLAEALADSRDFRPALENYRRSAGILEALVAAQPANAGNGDALATSYAGIGNVLTKTGDLNGALKMIHQAISLAESAATKSPDSKKYQVHLAQRYDELGAMDEQIAKSGSDSQSKSGSDSKVRSKGDLQEARQWLQKSLDLWQDLRAKGKLSGVDSHKPDEVAREIARCEQALRK